MEDNRPLKKFSKKIKIRLIDPSNPNSYVCEIIDDSLVNDADIIFDSHVESSNSCKSVNDSKLRSYFEILMSNKCKRNSKNNSIKENREILGKPKTTKKGFAKGSIVHRSTINQENSSKSALSGKVECKSDYSSDSDCESIFQVKKKIKTGKDLSKQVLNSHNVISKNAWHIDNQVVNNSRAKYCLTELPPPSKNFGILNYFSTSTNSHLKAQTEKLNSSISRSQNSNFSESTEIHVKNLNDVKENERQQERNEKIRLAPLFLFKEQKSISQAAKKASYNFLYGESLFPKAKDSNKCCEIEENSFSPTCHVQQKDDSKYWSIRKIPLLYCSEVPFLKNYNVKKQFRINLCKENSINSKYSEEESTNILCSSINKKSIIKIKSKYVTLNLDEVIDGMKKKKEKFAKFISELESSKFKLNDKVSEVNDGNFDPINSLWIDKYKPSSREILGNENVVKKLKDWLQSWKAFDEELKLLAKTKRQEKKNQIVEGGVEEESDDDDDYFIGSDDEQLKSKTPASVCLLSGPIGCGKTALITSLAQELDFNVLEVNASSKRTGKKVLTDFQEATQSHKVQQLPSHHNKKKSDKNVQKSRKAIKNCLVNANKTNHKISLLLIEDADIVFEEHDEGFYSAINSLVQTSKRPFVFVTNDLNCAHFDIFKMERCLILKMSHPSFDKSCAFLDVISMLEGIEIEKDLIECFVFQNKFDLRKSLLDLQFWSVFNKKISNPNGGIANLGNFWWGMSKFLKCEDSDQFKPFQLKRKRHSTLIEDSEEEEEETTTKKFKTLSSEKCSFVISNTQTNNLNFLNETLYNVLDVTSTLDLINLPITEEPTPKAEYRLKDSLSLDENLESVVYAANDLKKEISCHLIDLSTRIINKDKNFSFSLPSSEDIRWRELVEEANEELLTLVPMIDGKDKKSIHLDYLPIIRNICREEKNRSSVNMKRKNRFSHYFSNFNVNLSEKVIDECCQAFKV